MASIDKKDKIKKNVPSYFKPTTNLNWKALLEAHGIEDQKIVDQANEAKKQIFVNTAERNYLEALGDNVAVPRPTELNISDEKYSKLIKFLSFYPKQVKSLVLNILDVFYDPIFSRYNVQTTATAPFTLGNNSFLVYRTESDEAKTISRKLTADGSGNTIQLSTTSGMYVGQQVKLSDNNTSEKIYEVVSLTNTTATLDDTTINFLESDNAIVIFETYNFIVFKNDLPNGYNFDSALTTQTVSNYINDNATNIQSSSVSSGSRLNIRTNVPGNKGFIQILGGTANDSLQFDSIQGRFLRVQISEINPNELVIRVPSTVPSLRRILQGSAHLHSDSTLDIDMSKPKRWVGSFLYGGTHNYTVNKVGTTITQDIVAGLVYTQISVADASQFPNEIGYLIFNFGFGNMEQPVRYTGRPNNSTLLIDPTYVFTQNHFSGDSVNVVTTNATIPRTAGRDYPVYIVGLNNEREKIEQIVRSVVATGVIIRWDVDFPICGRN